MLEGDATYTISRNILLNDITVGLCSHQPIPVSKQAQILINDDTFTSPGQPAIVVNDSARLILESIHLDAYAWSSNYPVLLLLGRAEANINNSTLIRLASEGDVWNWGNDLYDYRASVHLDIRDSGVPKLTITDSRLFQGMYDGANIYGEFGGQIILTNTEQIVARNAIAINLCNTEFDVTGGSISKCPGPVSIDDYENLGRSARTRQEFCSSTSDSSNAWAYFGFSNLVNFQNITIKDSWSRALNFCSDQLKVHGKQNTGNRIQNFRGQLCAGYLQYEAKGAVAFTNGALCPPGSQLASSQTPKSYQTYSIAEADTTETGTTEASTTEASTTEASTTEASINDPLALEVNQADPYNLTSFQQGLQSGNLTLFIMATSLLLSLLL